MIDTAEREKKSILVVDDESVVRDLISGFLTKLGYEVHLAANGPGALALFPEISPPPKVVITDVVMPGMDGPTMVTEMRKSHPELCVLFVSSYSSKKLSMSELTKPTNGYLSKPFSFRGFAAAVKKLSKAHECSEGSS